MGRERGAALTEKEEELVCLPVERAFQALACFWRKCLRVGRAQLVRMIMHDLAQEADLFPVLAAPAANQQVKAHANAPEEGNVSVQSVGLKPGDLAAGWHESSEACFHDRAQALEDLHVTTVFTIPIGQSQVSRFRALILTR